jgi:hypothetical protein
MRMRNAVLAVAGSRNRQRKVPQADVASHLGSRQ